MKPLNLYMLLLTSPTLTNNKVKHHSKDIITMTLRKAFFIFLVTCSTFLSIAQTVHYTNMGAKYHATGCRHLRKSDYTCTLSEALNKGLGPCSQCNPPTEVEKPKPAVQPNKVTVRKKRATVPPSNLEK